MDRRAFLGTVAGCLLAESLAAEAQPTPTVPTVGVLVAGPSTSPLTRSGNEAFERGLREAGWIPGHTIHIEYRYAEGHSDHFAKLTTELVSLGARVIVARGGYVAQAAKRVAASVPIVMAVSGFDPVELGLVTSLAKPGGNVTGLTVLARELAPKQLELLRDTLPGLSRVGVLSNADSPGTRSEPERLEAAGRALRLTVQFVTLHRAEDLEKAFDSFRRAQAGAVLVLSDPSILDPNSGRIIALASKHRLPAMYWLRSYILAGGLISYGADLADAQRRAATFVDKILKGAKPSDLPVEQPTKFELVINLKTAKALGLTIPQSVLLRADEVIR